MRRRMRERPARARRGAGALAAARAASCGSIAPATGSRSSSTGATRGCTGSGCERRGRARPSRRSARSPRPQALDERDLVGRRAHDGPRDAAERLPSSGSSRTTRRAMTSLTMARAAARRAAAVEVRRVETLRRDPAGARARLGGLRRRRGGAGEPPRRDARRLARELEDERPRQLLPRRSRRRAGRLRPRSSSRRAAALLIGGATLPEARGRGVYTSLVHARWQAAVERGMPRLVGQRRAESAPILERLGFERDPVRRSSAVRQRIA